MKLSLQTKKMHHRTIIDFAITRKYQKNIGG